MLGQGDWFFSQPPIIQPQTIGCTPPTKWRHTLVAHSPMENYASTSNQHYEHVNFSSVEVARRSVRERPPVGARRKGKKKDTGTSRNFDEEADE
uniref:Uncharacterized protein n=1 Tax=Oryza punctata TaxID=4537 RepID=A0A0E0L0T3_ORYPU